MNEIEKESYNCSADVGITISRRVVGNESISLRIPRSKNV